MTRPLELTGESNLVLPQLFLAKRDAERPFDAGDDRATDLVPARTAAHELLERDGGGRVRVAREGDGPVLKEGPASTLLGAPDELPPVHAKVVVGRPVVAEGRRSHKPVLLTDRRHEAREAVADLSRCRSRAAQRVQTREQRRRGNGSKVPGIPRRSRRDVRRAG
jgi:hypothetical protein